MTILACLLLTVSWKLIHWSHATQYINPLYLFVNPDCIFFYLLLAQLSPPSLCMQFPTPPSQNHLTLPFTSSPFFVFFCRQASHYPSSSVPWCCIWPPSLYLFTKSTPSPQPHVNSNTFTSARKLILTLLSSLSFSFSLSSLPLSISHFLAFFTKLSP